MTVGPMHCERRSWERDVAAMSSSVIRRTDDGRIVVIARQTAG